MNGKNGRSRPRSSWVRSPERELLETRMCDLELELAGTALDERVSRLHAELEARDISFHPHCWLSEEWFSPDGVPGIAIPFYLAHPRLMRLERQQMLEVEGGTDESCMRILRHEAGHAIDTAFRLSRMKRWREVFGKPSDPYTDHYRPKPYSKSYVLHLDQWYAQSHPVEDFAETFAVWLKPRSRWRSQYQGWPALKKLEYVDDLMKSLKQQKPKIASRRKVEPLRSIRKTLGQHYQEKRTRYGIGVPNFYDGQLSRLFNTPEQGGRSAAAFLRRNRNELVRVIAEWTGEYRYTVDQVLGEVIERCGELDLRVDGKSDKTRENALAMLTVQTMNYLHNGHHRVAL